jgi:hypothetical protein
MTPRGVERSASQLSDPLGAGIQCGTQARTNGLRLPQVLGQSQHMAVLSHRSRNASRLCRVSSVFPSSTKRNSGASGDAERLGMGACGGGGRGASGLLVTFSLPQAELVAAIPGPRFFSWGAIP